MGKKGHPLGIDVGGSGVKGAPVDLAGGDLAGKRKRIPTPQPSTPEAVIDVIAEIVEHFADEVGDAPVGVTLPSIVLHGKVLSAANIDQAWIGFDAEKALEDKVGRDVTVVNDADAAGYAELHYGAAQGHDGLVIVTTLGTGIGSAMLYRGVLVPNCELGHLQLDGIGDLEKWCASSVKDAEGLSYPEWASRLQTYYEHVEFLFTPDLFVVGGGVSKNSDEFLPLLRLRTKIVPAQLLNQAGIVGAARLAVEASGQSIAKDGRAKAKK